MTWLPPEVTVAPASEPLSVADAAAHCRVVNGADDDYLLALTKAARAHVESYTGLKLVTQTVVLRCSHWGGPWPYLRWNTFGSWGTSGRWNSKMPLPVAPVQSITSVQYLDTGGALQTLSTDVWDASLYGLEPSIRLAYGQSWPLLFCGPESVIVTAVVGFTELPAEIDHAMKLLVGQWYDNRSTFADSRRLSDLPNAVEALLTNQRIFA